MQALPSYIDREAWDDYVAMRKRKGNPMTDRGIRQKLALLQRFKDAGHDVNEIIDAATNGGWMGFFEVQPVVITNITPSTARVTGEAAKYMDEIPGKPSDEARKALQQARSGLVLRRVA